MHPLDRKSRARRVDPGDVRSGHTSPGSHFHDVVLQSAHADGTLHLAIGGVLVLVFVDSRLELGVGEHAHLGQVEAGDLVGLGRSGCRPCVDFETVFWILKKAKATPKITVQITTTPSSLGAELAASRPRRGPRRPRRSEPFQPRAVAAVGEDADGEHAERCR